jgi:hypothetical protein
MKILILATLVTMLGGCTVYSDGTVSSAFDQGAIKAELSRAEKEYGNR